jgi:hypothetical protein
MLQHTSKKQKEKLQLRDWSLNEANIDKYV